MISQDDIRQLINDVAEIKKSLVGDTKWGNDGLIKDVAQLKKWQREVILRIAFWSGCATTVVIIVSHLWDYIVLRK